MRKKDNILTSIKALISIIINLRLFNNQLTKIDFEKELNSNRQLASSSEEEKQKFFKRLKKQTMNRGKLLRKKLLLSILWIILGLFISLIIKLLTIFDISIFLNQLLHKIPVNIYLGIASVIIFSIATLGRLGWEGQSWKNDTVYEQLDNRIFWILYLCGTILGCLAILL